jgi:fructose-bisphosphate aldolase, class II
MATLSEIVPAGVVTGDDVYNLFEYARSHGFAIPAVNCTRYVVCVWIKYSR